MPEVLDKEAMEFLTRLLGGTASALEQLVFAWYYQTYPAARTQFPFTRPLEQLPLWNDIIVGGISVGEALLGLGIEEDPLKLGFDLKTKEFAKGLRKFGEGGILYSVPMLTKQTIVKNVPPKPAPAPGARRQPPGAGKPAQGRVIKL